MGTNHFQSAVRWAIILLLAIVARQGFRMMSSSSSPGSAAESDKFCLDRLALPDAAEAREWLDSATAEQPHLIGNFETTKDSREVIDAMYADGAERVTVMEIHNDPDVSMTDQFVVTLPSDPAKRARLLNRLSKWAQDDGFDPVTDIGQKYQFVWFD